MLKNYREHLEKIQKEKRLLAHEQAETLLHAPSCGIPITWEVLLISQWKPNKISTNAARRLSHSADLQISDVDVAIAF